MNLKAAHLEVVVNHWDRLFERGLVSLNVVNIESLQDVADTKIKSIRDQYITRIINTGNKILATDYSTIKEQCAEIEKIQVFVRNYLNEEQTDENEWQEMLYLHSSLSAAIPDEVAITELNTDDLNASKEEITLSNAVNKVETSNLEEKTDIYKFEYLNQGFSKMVYSAENTALAAKKSDFSNTAPQFVVKVPRSAYCQRLQNEYISYKIGKLINLKVVPKAILIHHKWEKTKSLEKNYPCLKESLEKKWGQYQLLILQERLPFPALINKKIDIESAHRALFFNMITGRDDSKALNSMLDNHNRVWEVDNDAMYYKWTKVKDHWLTRTDAWNTEISEGILSDIVNLNPDLSALKIWTSEELSQEFKKEVSEAIHNNLHSVKTGIKLLRNSNKIISFKNLFEIMNSECS